MINKEKDVYTVAEIQMKLDIGKNKAYQLSTSGAFVFKRIGRTIVIPKKSFDDWLNTHDANLC